MNTLSSLMKIHSLIIAVILLSMPFLAQADDAAKNSTGIEIISIKYGSRPANLIPVTNKVMDILNSGGKITVSDSIVVKDPAPGEKKYVYIVCSMDGDNVSIRFIDGETFDLALLQKKLSELAGKKLEIISKETVAETKPVPDRNQKPGKFNPSEFRDSVDQAVDKISECGSSNQKVKGIEMICYSKAFKAISENPEVEKTMGIENEWYLNISKMLTAMGQYKIEIEVTEERGLTERMNAAKKSYSELSKKFKYLIEHPVKIQKKK